MGIKLAWLIGNLIKYTIYACGVGVFLDVLIGSYHRSGWIGMAIWIGIVLILWWLDDKMTEWLS